MLAGGRAGMRMVAGKGRLAGLFWRGSWWRGGLGCALHCRSMRVYTSRRNYKCCHYFGFLGGNIVIGPREALCPLGGRGC